MENRLFVGNLPFSTTEEDLTQAFSAFGEVTSARIITDKFSGRSRGFGFVEMANDMQAQAAVAGMDQQDFQGRPLTVNVARPREDA